MTSPFFMVWVNDTIKRNREREKKKAHVILSIRLP